MQNEMALGNGGGRFASSLDACFFAAATRRVEGARTKK
jgi:hypothetical protein